MYYARFENIHGHIFRFDTRVYLGEHDIKEPGICVGAVIGKNPGSAKPTRLGILSTLQLDGDKLLPTVYNRFCDAYEGAHRRISRNAYVQIWNLFYLCNPTLSSACKAIGDIPNPKFCLSERNRPRVTLFVWGGDSRRLNPFKERFLLRKYDGAFFYRKADNAVIRRMPTIDEKAQHTQGMPEDPIVAHLARVL